jgi:hypothetical protein
MFCFSWPHKKQSIPWSTIGSRMLKVASTSIESTVRMPQYWTPYRLRALAAYLRASSQGAVSFSPGNDNRGPASATWRELGEIGSQQPSSAEAMDFNEDEDGLGVATRVAGGALLPAVRHTGRHGPRTVAQAQFRRAKFRLLKLAGKTPDPDLPRELSCDGGACSGVPTA